MTKTKLLLSVAAASVLALNGCGGGGSSSTSTTPAFERPADCTSYTVPSTTTLSGDITTCTQLTAAAGPWIIDGLVAVKGTTLMIEPGTTVAGLDGTGAATSYLVVDRDAKLLAQGTAQAPIIFTSDIEASGGQGAEGQWGGLTIIGNAGNDQVAPYEVNSAFVPGDTMPADNSGILTYVEIHNSGITMEQDKEINGLSLVAVGSGTIVENITVNKSDDDCVEIWGGTVNLTDVTVRECTDDQFDIDDGYSGTVRNLDIHQTATNPGNAGIEQSGQTVATFDGFTIQQSVSAKEGGIYFKKAGIGGHFLNGTVTDNSADGFGAIHTTELGDTDIANTSFTNVTVDGSSADDRFTGNDAANVEAVFDAGTGNTKN